MYQFMDDHSSEFSIVKMSKVLGVSRSGYYRWRDRPPAERSLENERLTRKITQIWVDSANTYGSPRIHKQLLADGESLSRPRVARLMKKAGMASQIRPKWMTTTDSGHALPVAPNLLDRTFEAKQLGQAWVSDITYLPSAGGWLYLTTTGGPGGPPDHRLVVVGQHGRRSDDNPRMEPGLQPAPAQWRADLPFGSRGAVCLRGVYKIVGRRGGHPVDEPKRQLLGQCAR